MKKIRIGTFETNSSSTHVLVMCSQEEYDKFINGEIRYYNTYNSEGFVDENNPKFDDAETYEEFMPSEDDYLMEEFYEEYKTPSGEKVIAFGYHGNDN